MVSVITNAMLTATEKSACKVGTKVGTSLVAGLGGLAINGKIREAAAKKAVGMNDEELASLEKKTAVKAVAISALTAGIGAAAYEIIKSVIESL